MTLPTYTPVAPAAISVIVVNYGTAALAAEAVQSVLDRHHGGRVVDVHLVDNASPGDDAAVLARIHAERGWGGRVTLYPEKENHGFGRGNNIVLRALAARATPPDHVMFLNPDARLENEAIDILAGFLDTHPAVDVVGPAVSKPGKGPVSAAFRFPGAIAEFSQGMNFGPVARLLARWQVPLPLDQPAGQVDWVTGAAAFCRLKSLERAGFFDPAYFLYYEELDLMRQIARQGGRTWYLPEAHILHEEGAATGVKSAQPQRRRKPAYWYRSWYHYYTKNHGRGGAMLAGFCWLTGAALNHALCRVRGGQPFAPLSLFGDFWAVAGRPMFGLEPRDP